MEHAPAGQRSVRARAAPSIRPIGHAPRTATIPARTLGASPPTASSQAVRPRATSHWYYRSTGRFGASAARVARAPTTARCVDGCFLYQARSARLYSTWNTGATGNRSIRYDPPPTPTVRARSSPRMRPSELHPTPARMHSHGTHLAYGTTIRRTIRCSTWNTCIAVTAPAHGHRLPGSVDPAQHLCRLLDTVSVQAGSTAETRPLSLPAGRAPTRAPNRAATEGGHRVRDSAPNCVPPRIRRPVPPPVFDVTSARHRTMAHRRNSARRQRYRTWAFSRSCRTAGGIPAGIA